MKLKNDHRSKFPTWAAGKEQYQNTITEQYQCNCTTEECSIISTFYWFISSCFFSLTWTLRLKQLFYLCLLLFFIFFIFQTADLSLVFKDSSPSTPLIFVLSVGTDPAADLYKFAEEMRFSKKLNAISLGQGQVWL